MSDTSVWAPDAASDKDGNLYLAWDSYRDGTTISSTAAFGRTEHPTRSSRSPSRRASKPILLWQLMDRAGPGSPGTNPAPVGARTGPMKISSAGRLVCQSFHSRGHQGFRCVEGGSGLLRGRPRPDAPLLATAPSGGGLERPHLALFQIALQRAQ